MPCAVQCELALRFRKASADRAREDAEGLVALLRSQPDLCGRPAGDLGTVTGWSDRRLRAAAEASQGEVLSAPGCVGYRLAERTPVADYYNTERARFLSQIQVMQARLAAMDKAVHRANGSRR